MLSQDSEDEIRSRFVFELAIRLWQDELNPRVRFAFGNVFIPFLFPNFGNGFFSFPSRAQILNGFILLPSHSRTLEMKLYIPIPELIKVISARPWFIGLNKTSALQRKQWIYCMT